MILERTSMNEYSQLRAATVLQGKHYCLMTDEGLVVHMLIEKKYPLKKEILGNQLTLLLGEELASPRSNSSCNSDDIQAAGSDTRPPMLDRTDYESWSQRIQLYCRGKENGLQILQSIDQGPFELETIRDTLGTTPEGGVLLGPERPRTYEDLSDTEKKRYDADVRATNIVLQGLSKDIYKLINHNIEAKAIWDNIKMLLAGSQLTKEDRESQLYDEFKRFKMLPGENINEYYVRFHKLGNEGSLNRAGNANAGQGKPIKCYNCNGLRHNARNCTHRSVHKNSAYFKDKKPVDMNVTFDSDVEMMNRLSQTYSRPNFSTSQGQQIRKLGPSNASIYLKVYDQKTKTALGAQNHCYLKQAKKAQPALYDGDELLKPHHVPIFEVAFKKHTCFVRDLDGVDLIKGSRGTNLYTIYVEDMMRSSLHFALLSKALQNKSWFLASTPESLNFGTAQGKSRKATAHKPKMNYSPLQNFTHPSHGLMQTAESAIVKWEEIQLVIVDDYSRFTWVKFLRSKDETPAFVINLLKQLQVSLNKTVWFMRTDNGTEFVNKDLRHITIESVGNCRTRRTVSENSSAEWRLLSKVEPKNFKSAVTEDCWFQAMQDEIHEFDRLDVKLDENGDVLKTRSRLVSKGYRQEEGPYFEESFAPIASP
ncbi:retrovirus-related pol polyprotein from transposon TNT 1-94 [Tanacetum coccineum]